MVPNIPKITNFDECKPPDFMRFELDKSDLVVYVDGKLLKNAAIGGSVGFFGSIAYDVIQIAMNSGKKWAEFFTKEVLKNAVNSGIVGAAGGGFTRLVRVGIENFLIKSYFSPSLRVSIERCKDIINAFLEDESFIAENPKAEVICRITHTLIIHPTELRCKHVFSHIEIKEWVQDNSSCPTCRAPSEERDFQYSYATSIKVSFVAKRMFQRLLNFSAPDGIDIMNARNELRPIVESINEFNKKIYKGCRNHIQKAYPDEFNMMMEVVDNWKAKVDIPIG